MNEKIKAVILAVSILAGYYGVEWAVGRIGAPKAKQREEFVTKAMGAIHDPQGVKRLRPWSNFGVRGGRVRQPFTSDIDYGAARDFYRAQLEADGWTFLCEKESGGKNLLIFSREEYFAILELPQYSEQLFPPHAQFSYSFGFAIEVEWGIPYSC